MPFSGDHITQEHVNIARNYGRRLAKTPMGQLAGADELEAHAMVVLWDLALSYDDTLGVPFEAYLHAYVERRLIDWLRCEYGRVGHNTAKVNFHTDARSLDSMLENHNGEPHDAHPWLTDTRPGPEQHAIDRDQLAHAVRLINALKPRHRDALLHLARGQTVKEVVQVVGSSAPAFRHQAKHRLRSELGRDQDQTLTTEQTRPPVKTRLCDIEDCGREHAAKGLCQTHYMRSRRANSISPGVLVDA